MSCTIMFETFKKLGGKLGCDYDKQTCYLYLTHKFVHINQYCEFTDETKPEINKLLADMKDIPDKHFTVNYYLPYKFVIQLYNHTRE